MKKPTSFGIWANTDKKVFWDTFPSIIDWAKKNNLQLFVTTRIESRLKNSDFDYKLINNADDFNKVDFVLSLGGDGTILSLARAVAERGTPILGIHLGELGFLAEVVLNDMYSRMGEVLNGDFLIQKRMAIKESRKQQKDNVRGVKKEETKK